jgi:excisionase family DNA binding protein
MDRQERTPGRVLSGEGDKPTGEQQGHQPGWESLLTVTEASQCVGCCEETIRRAYSSRQLDVLRFGSRSVRIRPSALFAWLKRGGKTTAA